MTPEEIEKLVKESRGKGDFDKDWEEGKDVTETQVAKDETDDTGADGT